jgi:hypothetical protein
MIGRRTLIRISALFGTFPAFAGPIVLSSPILPESALARDETETVRVAFKIEGWESRRDDVIGDLNVASTESATEAWVSIDRSWRAAWR